MQVPFDADLNDLDRLVLLSSCTLAHTYSEMTAMLWESEA